MARSSSTRRIRSCPLSGKQCLLHFGGRQPDGKGTALARFGLNRDIPVMLVDQRSAHCESEAGPLSRWLSREERVEDALHVLRADARARVSEPNEELVLLQARAYFQLTTARHRLNGIHRQIREDLGHPADIDADPW